jgi:hypothetical protein
MMDAMNPADPNSVPAAKTLMTIRIIWFAMLMGELMFLGIVAFVILPNHGPPQLQPILVWVNVIMLLTIVPATFAIRAATFRRTAINGAVPAGPFVTGNIIFWAGCEGVCFFAVVIAVMTGSLWPTILVAVIALSLQALTFPVGGRLYLPTGGTTHAQ